MKKKIAIKIMLVVGMVALGGWVLSSGAWAVGITGSAHDFSAASWNTTNGEICQACHTPHNADTTVSDAPLWNHKVTTATFTAYTSSTLDAAVGSPDGLSKLCLSCHDGTVALDSFGGATGSTNFMTGDPKLGTDLSNDHPISFTYDATLATTDGGLVSPNSASAVDTAGVVPLFNAKVECSSCHDVHNGADPVTSHLLVKSNAASALCLTCHNK